MQPRQSATLLVALALAALCSAAPQEEKYPTRYDGIDFQALLADKSQVDDLVKCFLQEGDGEPCSEMGGRVKAVLPEALPSDCAKCSATQRERLATVVKLLAARRPAEWKQLEKKFDPEGKYAKAHSDLF